MADSDESDSGWVDTHSDHEEQPPVVSLLDNEVFPDVLSMLTYCREKYSFDFLGVRQELGLDDDFHGTVKLINYIRCRVKDGLGAPGRIESVDISGDGYLKPVISDDALIFRLDELSDDQDQHPTANSADAVTVFQENSTLRQELAELREHFAKYRLAVEQTLEKRWGDDDSGVEDSKGQQTLEEPSDSKYYFESYAGNDIHETMLKDKVRTEAYRDFIYENKHLFEGKVVLDVGCGTGILSMFCAKAGARKVIAVEKSTIIEMAWQNIVENELSDVVTCVKGTVEEVKLPVEQVDIIVSEWMGYCLLYEAMLPSVIWARDKYLKPGGLLVPSHTTLWISPMADPDYCADHVTFWRDVYGFDMRGMQTKVANDARVATMHSDAALGMPFPFRHLNLYKVSKQDLAFKANWEIAGMTPGSTVDGFLVWFDIFFAQSDEQHVSPTATAIQWAKEFPGGKAFTTGPFGEATHWSQGVLLTETAISLGGLEVDGKFSGEISFEYPEENRRSLRMRISWGVNDERDSEASHAWLLQ